MTPEQFAILCICLSIIAFLYSCVGHAGASGYIAIMGLLGLAPGFIKPTALVLNILVASIATWQFRRAGHFKWRTFWPYASLSIPFAFIGGYLNLPFHVFKIIIGFVLMFSAVVLVIQLKSTDTPKRPALGTSMSVGAGLGLLAGLTGTGGGIFLTPTLILFRWAKTKTAAATSALFIFVNSLAGLTGAVCTSHCQPLKLNLIPLAASVLVGGALGSYLGSSRFPREIIRLILALVLVTAGLKLTFS